MCVGTRGLSADQLARRGLGRGAAGLLAQGAPGLRRATCGRRWAPTSSRRPRRDTGWWYRRRHRLPSLRADGRAEPRAAGPERAGARLVRRDAGARALAWARLEDVESWEPGGDRGGPAGRAAPRAEELRVEACLRPGVMRACWPRPRHGEGGTHARAAMGAARDGAVPGGRQTESLRTLHRVKSLLADKLGLDPGPELDALEQSILRQDASLLIAGSVRRVSTCPYRGLRRTTSTTPTSSSAATPTSSLPCAPAEHGSLAVVGPSGCGKSSLVRAGVAAALRRDGLTRRGDHARGCTRGRRSAACPPRRRGRAALSTSARRPSRCARTTRSARVPDRAGGTGARQAPRGLVLARRPDVRPLGVPGLRPPGRARSAPARRP